ncbi:MAG: chemotaxis protein CheD [Syntrophaceae bacterium]
MSSPIKVDPPTIFLKPGEAHCGQGPARVVTILGSCVSIVLFHQVGRFGAICHAMQPSQPFYGCPGPDVRHDLDSVDGGLDWMLSEFAKRGLAMDKVEAKVFGGAAMLGGACDVVPFLAVGSRNLDAAFQAIRRKKIRLTAWDVGGKQGRKIIFYLGTGEVLTQFVSKTKRPDARLTL